MTYFVTGATGFIGRHLVEELLATARATIFVLVREGSRERLERADRAAGARGEPRHARSIGDLAAADARRRRATGSTSTRGNDRPLLPPRRDLRHDGRRRAQRRRSTSAARATRSSWPTRSRPAASTTSPRSPSPARYKGLFREDMFDEGQKLPSPYHRTKFESEKIVRERAERAVARLPARRSSSATRETGEMDKIDGPYYFFKAIQKAAPRAARVVPAGRPRARLHEHRAGRLRRRARWTTSPTSPTSTARPSTSSTPKSQRSGDVLNTFASAAHAPQHGDAHRQAPDRRAAQGRRCRC